MPLRRARWYFALSVSAQISLRPETEFDTSLEPRWSLGVQKKTLLSCPLGHQPPRTHGLHGSHVPGPSRMWLECAGGLGQALSDDLRQQPAPAVSLEADRTSLWAVQVYVGRYPQALILCTGVGRALRERLELGGGFLECRHGTSIHFSFTGCGRVSA